MTGKTGAVWLVALWLALAGMAHGVELRTRPPEWAQPVLGMELGNFYLVSPELYRSQQPEAEELRRLQQAGIRSVLSLREYHSDDADAAPGLKLYDVPMNAGEIDDAKIEKALKVLATAPKPVLVHCWHGSDRTGVVVAVYRMVFQQWPRERAIDEFVNGGYGYHRSVYPNIEEYLRNVDIERMRQRVGVR